MRGLSSIAVCGGTCRGRLGGRGRWCWRGGEKRWAQVMRANVLSRSKACRGCALESKCSKHGHGLTAPHASFKFLQGRARSRPSQHAMPAQRRVEYHLLSHPRPLLRPRPKLKPPRREQTKRGRRLKQGCAGVEGEGASRGRKSVTAQLLSVCHNVISACSSIFCSLAVVSDVGGLHNDVESESSCSTACNKNDYCKARKLTSRSVRL